MSQAHHLVLRRRLLQAAVSSPILLLPEALASRNSPTPTQPRGPFYPDHIPLDQDNDLVRVEGREGLARGEITDLLGRVLDVSGQPVENALLEIWQCDANGRYLHRFDNRGPARDANFQGFGRFTTAADGRYRFRTIKPVPYPGRAAHIHMAVRAPGRRALVTQIYVAGAPENQSDWLLNRIAAGARERLVVDFRPQGKSAPAAFRAHFDIILDART